MENSKQQLKKNGESKDQQEKNKKETDVVLPTETSPYVKYEDLEDYKRKGYGAEGHLEPVIGRGAGATDAPTPSGAAPTGS